jgi:hypothetical protein
MWNLPSKFAVACFIKLPMPSSDKTKKELALQYDTLYSRRRDKQGDKGGHA